MHEVIMAIGSNAGQEANVCFAIEKLKEVVGGMACSRKVWTEPIGVRSGMFLNCVVAGKTMLGRGEMESCVKGIEALCGRNPEETRAGMVRLDIDLLKYDGEIFHAEDWERTYVRQLMAEI